MGDKIVSIFGNECRFILGAMSVHLIDIFIY